MIDTKEVVLPATYTNSARSRSDLCGASVWISPTDKADAISGAQPPIDFAIVLFAGFLSYFLRHGTFEIQTIYWLVWLLGATLHINISYSLAAYQPEATRNLLTLMRKSVIAWSSVSLSIIVIMYFTKVSADLSRASLVMWFVIGIFFMLLSKTLYVGLMKRWQFHGKMVTRVALIAAADSAIDFLRYFDRFTPPEMAVLPCQALPPADPAPLVAELQRQVREGKIDHVIIACDLPIDPGVERLISQIRTLPVGIQLCPKSLMKLPDDAKCLIQFGLPMISIAAKPLAGRERIVKRLVDIVLAVLLLTALAPVAALIALLVRIDTPGPAIFRQKRFGFNGEVIEVFKFRTMHVENRHDPNTPQARRNDNRVTRVGRLLRASSLDELPQLLNVLKGEMSMVGPRPHAVAHNEHYAKLIGGYMARHRVKPGITGWAQVNGLRGETTPASMRTRVEHDLFYIENWTLLFDLRILMRTAFVGFVHQNAY